MGEYKNSTFFKEFDFNFFNKHNNFNYDTKKDAFNFLINSDELDKIIIYNENKELEEKFKKLINLKKLFDHEYYYNTYNFSNDWKDKKLRLWTHYINHGFLKGRKCYKENKLENKEGKFSIINEISYSGQHLFGWNGCINNLLNKNKDIFNKYKFNYNIIFDSWLEKLFYWGNKNDKNKFIDKLKNNNTYFISFLHNPPNKKYLELSYEEKINKSTKEIIVKGDLNDTLHCNIKTLDNIDQKYIDKLKYLFVLSNDHKKYLCESKPEFIKKVISIKHPMREISNKFNLEAYLNSSNKKILHIGWFLRNFKIFCETKFPPNYKKHLLVKHDFIDHFKIKDNLNLNDIKLETNINNSDFINLTNNSIIFIYLEDATANNSVLESIEMNIPIIINKLDSVVEYLGKDYPMYYEDILPIINCEEKLNNKIKDAYNYLCNMDKNEINLDYFNRKFKYHMDNLSLKKNKTKLTWICSCFKADKYIKSYIQDFLDQSHQDRIELHIYNIVNSHREKYTNEFIWDVEKKYENIKVFNVEKDKGLYETWNTCIKNTNTEYVTTANLDDRHRNDYSIKFIDFLDNTPNCDIAVSSCSASNIFMEKFECTNNWFGNFYNKFIDINTLFKYNIPHSCPVWRKEIHNFIGYFEENNYGPYADFEFWLRALKYNFNINFINTKEPLYLYYIDENSHNRIYSNESLKEKIDKIYNK